MQFRSVLVAAIGIGVVAAGLAVTAEKSIAAGGTRLSINNSGPVNLVGSGVEFIDYWNRSVANGRRAVKLRVGQPLLCVDFATAPGVGSNPVALQYADPNNDLSPQLFGAISSFDYLTNGASASLFKVTSGAELACCTMLPAANASCYQGNTGGIGADSVYRNGFETTPSAPQGGPVDLEVAMSGSPTASAGNNYVYTITVTNNGGSPVSGVRVRDWYPKASGGFPATLSTSSWTCSPAGACGTTSGNGNIALDAVSLGANSSLTLNVSRLVDAANPGATFSVSAAAFAPPASAEGQLGNNQAALTAVVAQTTLSISDRTQAEGNSGSSNFQFTITRSNTDSAVSVTVNTADGSATAGSDYTALAGGTQLNFTGSAGETRTQNVSITGDTILEGNETFQLTLGTPSNPAVTVSTANATGTINNDDSASLSINDVTVVEGNSGTTAATFTVTLNGAVQGGFTLPVTSVNGSATAPSDYLAIPGGEFLTFAGTAGETRTATVNVNGDNVLEPNETFQVNLSAPSNAAVQIADGSGTATINNDDNAAISINDVTVTEGSTGNTVNATFTVTLNNPVQGGFTVLPVTANFTATAPSDYASYAGGALSFTGTANETRTLDVVVNGDSVLEGNENFFVNLNPPSNPAVTLGDAQGIGTISNDDAASLSINDVTVTEGNTGTVNATFTITLNGSVQEGFEVPVSSADGTATVANNDYVAIPAATTRAFTGALGETRTISVTVNGDTAAEPNETFTVNLGLPVGSAVTLSDGQGTGTINDDDSSAADKRR